MVTWRDKPQLAAFLGQRVSKHYPINALRTWRVVIFWPLANKSRLVVGSFVKPRTLAT